MTALVISACFLFGYMCAAYVVAMLSNDTGIADVAYGGGFAIVAWTTYLQGQGTIAGFIVSALVTIWGLRIATRIYLRNRGRGEDFRYAKWRAEWGKSFLIRSFFQVFLLQGLIIFIVSLPVAILNVDDTSPSIALFGYLGIIIWLKGFFFEAVGDYQLDRFLNKPENKGHIMHTGLWKYTRHPNYYGESLMWWGIAITAYFNLALWDGYLIPLVVFVSPILITFLLIKVSGIPMVEKHLEGMEWAEYKKKTSVFIPWFPKKS